MMAWKVLDLQWKGLQETREEGLGGMAWKVPDCRQQGSRDRSGWGFTQGPGHHTPPEGGLPRVPWSQPPRLEPWDASGSRLSSNYCERPGAG